jgi:DNA-binding IclR family transcriptional regulator
MIPDRRASKPTPTGAEPNPESGRQRAKPGRRPEGILVLQKVRAILDAFADGLDHAGPAEMAARIGTNKSTTFRILKSMEQVGLLDRSPDGTYALGIRLMELGALVGERLDLRRLAEPTLRQLRDAVGQTVFLTVCHDDFAVCIDRLPGSHVEVMALRLGGRLPLYCGAAPRVLLAGLDESRLERYLARAPFEPRTPHTLTTAAELRADIDRTRSQGYTLSLEDVTLGVAAVGAPVFDHRGEVIAAISIADLRHAYEGARLPVLVEQVRRAAAEVTARLGGTARGWG